MDTHDLIKKEIKKQHFEIGKLYDALDRIVNLGFERFGVRRSQPVLDAVRSLNKF